MQDMSKQTKPILSERESMYRIAGNVPDPSGQTNLRGRESTLDMTAGAIAHPLLRWRDRVVEADLYLDGGKLLLHLICPKCSTSEEPHGLWVREGEKAIEWSEGLLSVEPITCPWELPEGRKEFGVGMCRWRVAIERGQVREL